MGQKIHPLGFRLGITQEHTAHWFVPKSEYAGFLYQDILIRNYDARFYLLINTFFSFWRSS